MMLLVGLALVPLFGVAWFTASAYRDVDAARDVVDEVRVHTAEARVVDELRLAVVDERYWFSIVRGLEDFGIDPAIAGSLIDMDLREEYDTAVATVDELVADGPGADFADAVAEARSIGEEDLTAGLEEFDAVASMVGDRGLDLRDALVLEAGSIDGGADIVIALRLNAAALDARFEHGVELWTYFRAEFSELSDAGPSYLALGTHRDRRETALHDIERGTEPGSTLRLALDDVRGSEQLATFDRGVEATLAGVFDRPDAATTSEAEVIAKVIEVAQIFRAGNAALAEFDGLIDVADAELTAVSDELAESAATHFRDMVVALVALALLAVAIAFALARYIGAPMVRLADAATLLGSGAELDVSRSGPAEVRRVGEALEAAAAGLALVERLEHEATHDDLTGVPTRKTVIGHLDRALSRARRSGQQGAVLFVDIDHFKDVNDTFGHAAGDVVLTTVAERIRANLRLGDELGRFGGDEFVVIAESIGTDADLRAFADRIVEAVSEPIELDDVVVAAPAEGVVVTVSIGATTFGETPEAGEDVLRRADAATYRAKAEGRDRTAFAPQSLDATADAPVIG